MREMKDSGIEWIGDIPVEWEIVPVKHFFRNRKRIVGEAVDKYERLALTMSGVIKRSKEDNEGLQPEKFEGYQILCKNELVFKLIDLENVKTSRVGLSPYTGLVSPAYIVLSNNRTDNRYFYYWFMFMYYNEVFNHLGEGVRSALNAKDVLSLPVVGISEEEKCRIANYLDGKCTKIDAIIEKQQKVIEKLKEYKVSVITEAVTKGLNPDVEMKDSGENWCGKIPKHWQMHKFCWDYEAMLGKMLDAKRITGNNLYPYIKNNNIQWGSINIQELDEMDFEGSEVERYSVKPGDLMICEGGEIGKCAIIPKEFPHNIFYQKALHRVRKRNEHSGNIQFLYYIIYAMAHNQCFSTSPEKATIAHLPGEALNQLKIPTPPIEEQATIAKWLEKKCSKVDSIISRKQKEISMFVKYKKSLIYEVVTGKKEV